LETFCRNILKSSVFDLVYHWNVWCGSKIPNYTDAYSHATTPDYSPLHNHSLIYWTEWVIIKNGNFSTESIW